MAVVVSKEWQLSKKQVLFPNLQLLCDQPLCFGASCPDVLQMLISQAQLFSICDNCPPTDMSFVVVSCNPHWERISGSALVSRNVQLWSETTSENPFCFELFSSLIQHFHVILRKFINLSEKLTL